MTGKTVKEDWMKTKWRPMMGWLYMIVCIFDFIVFPIGFTIVQFWETEAANDAFRQWNPLTLQGAGLFHMAMGAVLGITAWSRGQEKIAGATSIDTSNDYGRNTYSQNSKFSSSYETLSVQPASNLRSKKAPIQEPDPEL